MDWEIQKDEVLCDEADIDSYVAVLNGIVIDCYKNGGFSHGYRNMIAVDMTVSAYMLGLDAIQVLDEFVKHGVIDPKNDDEDTYDRVRTVLDYNNSFCWTWMIDPDVYESIDLTSNMPITFIAR